MRGAAPAIVYAGGTFTEPGSHEAGLLSGMGVFETLSLRRQAFAPTRHLARLVSGARRMGLPEPDLTEIRRGITEVERAWAERGWGRLRITWTAGASGSGSLVITAAPTSPATSARVHLSGFIRNERSALTGVKSISYAENLLALTAARERGADEAIFANTAGELCEGATSNIFIETAGELLTPPLSSGCLPGITRELILAWAAEAGIPIREVNLPLAVMKTTQHAALTSAIKGIVPVIGVDGRALEPGPKTQELAEIYAAERERTPDP